MKIKNVNQLLRKTSAECRKKQSEVTPSGAIFKKMPFRGIIHRGVECII